MGYTSQIPSLDSSHVFATSEYSSAHQAYMCCNPNNSLTGDSEWDCWASQEYVTSNQELTIILNSACVIKRIYYENFQDLGGGAEAAGVQAFGFQESSDGVTWRQLGVAPTSFVKHVSADQADPQYILVGDGTSCAYFKFVFANNYGGQYCMGIRRIELQTEDEAPPPPPEYAPTLAATTAATATSLRTATSGGNVTDAGTASVTARGVCWSTLANPTTANSKTTDGTGTGVFTSALTGLVPKTLYHVRAYATNSVGTGYGTEITFTTKACLPIIIF